MSNQELVQRHCEHKSAQLFGALDALQSLHADERKAVLKALRADNTQPLTNFMAGYRRQLAENIG